MPVPSLGFGPPAVAQEGKKLYTAFISQNGNFCIWEDDELIQESSVKLDGVFFAPPVTDGKFFYVLSKDGLLSRIDFEGNIENVKIPSIRNASSGIFLSAQKNIYVSPGSNLIYAFTPELELVYGYPVSGYGNACFADLNGDRQNECICLSLDETLCAWNLN